MPSRECSVATQRPVQIGRVYCKLSHSQIFIDSSLRCVEYVFGMLENQFLSIYDIGYVLSILILM
jgi:hypothetical protein